MKALVSFLLALLLTSSLSAQENLPQGSHHNKIDDLKTLPDIQKLLISLDPYDSNFVVTDSIGALYESKKRCKYLMDSLGAKMWVKVDLDGNGYTDMIVSGMIDEYFRSYCIMDSGNSHLYTVRLTTLEFQPATYPVVKMICGQCAILYYNTRDKHHYNDSLELLHVDTLIFRKGFLTELNLHPSNHFISKIQFHLESVWGDFRSVALDANGPETCGLYNTPKGKSIFKEAADLLNYSDFTRIDSTYTVQWTDAATGSLYISYDDGERKTIEDYGMQGSYALMHLYDLLLSTERECRRKTK